MSGTQSALLSRLPMVSQFISLGIRGLMSDMKTIINGFYKIKLVVFNMSSVEKAVFAVNELIQPERRDSFACQRSSDKLAGRLNLALGQGNLLTS